MNKTNKGAWLVNHTKKLKGIDSADFQDIELAGKCGIFLSNLAASDEQSDLNVEKVEAIATVSDLKLRTELPAVIEVLSINHLIDRAKSGAISVLGVTTSKVLEHTTDIFTESKPNNYQKAALELSETVSEKPLVESELSEYISDKYKLSKDDTKSLIIQSEDVGFIDYEKLDKGNIYFNGNLFRRENIQKVETVLSSLKPEEITKVNEVDALLNAKGCMDATTAKNILSKELLEKLQSIGMYDINKVSNDAETKLLMTKPGAFSKFGNPFAEDALDLAKAFVASLYYGMNYSTYSRGQIRSLEVLLTSLINGNEIGPATAIGQDYQILEMRRVIQTRPFGYGFKMRLLKKDVGVLALKVLQQGHAIEQTVLSEPSKSVTSYSGPEAQRVIRRKKQLEPMKKGVGDLLRTFRKG